MTGTARPDVVCVSHLWWDWVWQRPQQLLSRLAARWPVFWVDEPRLQIGPAGDRFEVDEPLPGVRVARLLSRHEPSAFRQRLDEAPELSGARAFAVSDDTREAGMGFASSWQPRLERDVLAAVLLPCTPAAWRSSTCRGPISSSTT